MLSIGNLRYLLSVSNIKQVARDTGIHYNTLYGIARGNSTTTKTVEILSEYFTLKDRAHDKT